jgi:hypothetical protein
MSAPEARERFPSRALLALLGLAVVLRLGTDLSRVDEYYGEGLYRGTLAQALVEGAPLWPAYLPEIPHVRGSVAIGVLAAPFYAIFGPTTASLRIAGILFHLAAVATWMLLVHRRLGARASVLAGALFVLAPPGLAKLSVLSYGDHIESFAFFAGAAALALDWIEDRTGRRFLLAAATGVCVGVAIGFHAQAILGIAALGATCAVLSPLRLLRRDFWLGFVPGLAVGLVPLFVGNAVTGKNALLLWGRSPTSHLTAGGLEEKLEKLATLWKDDFATSFQLERKALAYATLLLSAACLAGLAIATFRRWRRGQTTLRGIAARAGFFVAYPAVFSVAYAASGSEIQTTESTLNALDVRYTQPVIPFLLLPIAVAGARLLQSGRRALAIAVVGPALALGAYGSLSTWHVPTILREPARRGYLWEYFTHHLLYGTLDDRERAELHALEGELDGAPDRDAQIGGWLVGRADPMAALELIRRLDSSAAWTYPLRYLPHFLALGLPPEDSAESRVRWIRRSPPALRPHCAAGAGSRAASAEPFDPEEAPALIRGVEGAEVKIAVPRGFGHGLLEVADLGRVRFWRGPIAAARLETLPGEAEQDDAAFGLGFRIGSLLSEFFAPGDEIVGKVLGHFHRRRHGAFVRGLGAGYRLRFLDPPQAGLESPAVRRILTLLPDELEPDFRAGLGGASESR